MYNVMTLCKGAEPGAGAARFFSWRVTPACAQGKQLVCLFCVVIWGKPHVGQSALLKVVPGKVPDAADTF